MVILNDHKLATLFIYFFILFSLFIILLLPYYLLTHTNQMTLNAR